MRLFEIQPGEAEGKDYSIWHLDLDHVVSMRDWHNDDRIIWVVETTKQIIFVNKACFERMMLAWEAK